MAPATLIPRRWFLPIRFRLTSGKLRAFRTGRPEAGVWKYLHRELATGQAPPQGNQLG